MFPREITSTTVWIRHELPLFAPPPPDGNKKLRRKMRTLLINATEQEIDEIVQNERARLNLKWCFDEYFGGPIANLNLGEIVTANVFGNVHLAYIVDITSFSITLVSADTFTVLPVVDPDDIYTAEYSPFFDNYLQCQRVYHAQHVLDWWRKRIQRRHDLYFSPPDGILLFPMCNDITSDWPVGEETWFIHDLLPQRSQFAYCIEEQIPCIPAINVIGYTAQPLTLFPDSSPVPNDQQLHKIHCSYPDVVTTARRHRCSVWIDMPNPVVPEGQRSSFPKLCLHKGLHPLSFSLFIPSLQRQPSQLFLFSILILCFITALSSPVKYHDEGSRLTLDSDMAFDSLSSYHFLPQSLSFLRLLHDINNWDWFRVLAVP